MADLKVHVGDTAEDMGRRFSDAWQRAEHGEAVNERHLSFDSFGTLARILTSRATEKLSDI
jgi:predicted transcriptional regulator